MDKKLQITVFCGGQSTEHAISLLSAHNVVNALDRKKYSISIIYITESGKWYRFAGIDLPINIPLKEWLSQRAGERVTPYMGEVGTPWISASGQCYQADVVFPVLHGTNGEDGTIQGLFDLLGVPYVSCGALSSSICMDKSIAKTLLHAAGLPVVPWVTVTKNQSVNYHELVKQFGALLFVKAGALGSSVGVYKAHNETEFYAALKDAFKHDEHVLVEQCMVGRELECAVLGNENPEATLPGEIVLKGHEYYSYEAKYCDSDGVDTVITADLPQTTAQAIQSLAIKAFQTLRCSGMARVDFFLTKDGKIFINELNTIPGFTNISMYPKMWEASGVDYSTLLDRLIHLGLKRHQFLQEITRIYRHD